MILGYSMWHLNIAQKVIFQKDFPFEPQSMDIKQFTSTLGVGNCSLSSSTHHENPHHLLIFNQINKDTNRNHCNDLHATFERANGIMTKVNEP